MFDFYQRRKIKSFLTMPITRIILLILALLMCWGAYTRYEKAELVKVRRVEAEQELEHLRGQKEALEKQVKYLSDERGIEAEMRRQFDVALPGEQVVVIVDPEKKESTTSTSTTKVEEDVPWYMFWR
jgi:cell division protein FtsB